MNRIDRLTAMIIYLQGRKRVGIQELAGRYSISERTAFRDLRALQEAGVPIASEPGAGYYIHYKNDNEPIADSRLFSSLQNAIFIREIIEIGYLTPYKQEKTIREVEPLGLISLTDIGLS